MGHNTATTEEDRYSEKMEKEKMLDNNRLIHSLAVARKMLEIAKKRGLTIEEQEICFFIGFNHDIGYEFASNNLEHNKIGGNLLKITGFNYWKEVYYHGEIDCKYESLYLTILNQADMQIDMLGNDVGYKGRLQDIKNRYGENSNVYKKCKLLIKKLEEI